MGNYTSKLFSYHTEDNKVKLTTNIKLGLIEKQHPCTPVMTKRHLTADPRSATLEIVRTPIETAVTPAGPHGRVASAIPKHLKAKQYLETDIDSVISTINSGREMFDPRSPNVDYQRTPIIVKPPSSPPPQNYLTPIVHVKQTPDMDTPLPSTNGFDPRSPAIDFDRTPILKPKTPDRFKVLEDIVADKCTKSSEQRMIYCETIIDYNVPEIQVLPEISLDQATDVRTGLLDKISNNQLDCSIDRSNLDESDSEAQITVIPNIKTLTNGLFDEQDLFDQKLTNFVVKQEEKEEELRWKILDPKSVSKKLFTEPEEKIRIWRDSISPEIPNDLKTEGTTKREEIMIEFDDNQSLQKIGQLKINENGVVKADENVKSNLKLSTGKKKRIQQSKKDVKAVYEDREVKTFNIEGAVHNICKNRTPLANRSNSHHKTEIPTKSPQQLLRNKCLSTKLQQQENTPPRNKNMKKGNFMHWDLDKTVII